MERAGDNPPPPRTLASCEQSHAASRLWAVQLSSSDSCKTWKPWFEEGRWVLAAWPSPAPRTSILPARSTSLVTPLCRAIPLHGQVMFKETNERNDTAQNTGVRKYIARCLSWGSCKRGLSYYIFQRGCLCHHQVRHSPCPTLHSNDFFFFQIVAFHSIIIGLMTGSVLYRGKSRICRISTPFFCGRNLFLRPL